ncbi:hypothetical protein SUGI_0798560 [Cryptomeria japonica]|nr:hypothetical protein SUGI_0798560 [Cryptomeria japonica]
MERYPRSSGISVLWFTIVLVTMPLCISVCSARSLLPSVGNGNQWKIKRLARIEYVELDGNANIKDPDIVFSYKFPKGPVQPSGPSPISDRSLSPP